MLARFNQKGWKMRNDYKAYHSDKYGLILQSLPDSVGNIRAVLGSTGSAIDFVKMPAAEFNKRFCGGVDRPIVAEAVLPNKSSRTLTPQEVVAKMLGRKLPITQPALERIEAMFQTKGKSTQEIRAEIVRLAGELPEGNVLRAVPETYPDRSQAIAAYTLMRQTLFQLNSKEKSMTEATVAEAVPAKKARKAAPNGAEAPKARKAATKNGTTPEAKKPSKAKVTKPAEAPAKRGRKAKAVEAKPAKAKKATRAPRTEAPSAYKVAGNAVTAKTTADLRMQEGSARTQVMNIVLSNKKRKSFTADDFSKIEGAQSALRYLVGKGYLAAA